MKWKRTQYGDAVILRLIKGFKLSVVRKLNAKSDPVVYEVCVNGAKYDECFDRETGKKRAEEVMVVYLQSLNKQWEKYLTGADNEQD